jgi:hypothetical protein
MPKLFHSLTPAHKAAILSALAAASLPVTAVEGGVAAKPTESTHAANNMRMRLTWPEPPTSEQIAVASAVITAYPWI